FLTRIPPRNSPAEAGPGSSLAVELRRTRLLERPQRKAGFPAHRIRRPRDMATRRPYVLVLAGMLALPCSLIGATYTTQNFSVDAPTAEIARQIGERAEHFLRGKAIQSRGRGMAQRGRRCPATAKGAR